MVMQVRAICTCAARSFCCRMLYGLDPRERKPAPSARAMLWTYGIWSSNQPRWQVGRALTHAGLASCSASEKAPAVAPSMPQLHSASLLVPY